MAGQYNFVLHLGVGRHSSATVGVAMNTYIVVGHGVTPMGQGWGHKIDSSYVVMRMWNWHWQNVKDFGQRFDYGFYEISPTEMVRFHRHCVYTPSQHWVGSWLEAYEGELPRGTRIINPSRWELAAVDMGGHGANGKRLRLTRGVRAALWLITQVMRKEDQLVLVGFDNVRASMGLPVEQAFPKDYLTCPAMFPLRDYVGGTPQYRSHDYTIEGPLLKKFAELNKVKVVHAQDIWKC